MAKPLFILPTEIRPGDYGVKLAATNLQSAPSQWDNEVLQNAFAEYDFLPPERSVVVWRKRDDARGFAVGEIRIQGTQIGIPIIIAQGQMKPLDVMIIHTDDNAEVLPLNEDNFLRYSSSVEQGQGPVVNNDVSFNRRWNEAAPLLRFPVHGRYAYASAMPQSAATKQAFAKLAQVPDIQAGFFMSGTTAVVSQWLEAPEGPSTVATKLASLQLPQTQASVLSVIPTMVPIAEFKCGQVMGEDGNLHDALKLASVALEDPKNTYAFLAFGDGTYCIAPDKVAVTETGDIKVAEATVATLSAPQLKVGSIVSFVLGDSKVSAPAQVTGLSVDDTVKVQMGPTTVFLSPVVKVATRLEKGNWILPLNAPMLTFSDEPRRLADEAKMASALQHLLPHQLMHTNGTYTLTIGNSVCCSGMTRDEIKMAGSSFITNFDSLLEQVHQQTKMSSQQQILRFAAEIPNPLEISEKIATVGTEYKGWAAGVAKELQLPLDKAVKLASLLQDEGSVDAVLGLGILTEDNLAEFIGLADELRTSANKLAKLLLMIRLGAPQGDETSTATALHVLCGAADKIDQLTNYASS